MSKFNCICGFVIDLSTSPADEEKILVDEIVIDEIGSRLALPGISSEEFFRLIDQGGVQALRCPQCDRLWLYDPTKKVYESFVREKM